MKLNSAQHRLQHQKPSQQLRGHGPGPAPKGCQSAAAANGDPFRPGRLDGAGRDRGATEPTSNLVAAAAPLKLFNNEQQQDKKLTRPRAMASIDVDDERKYKNSNNDNGNSNSNKRQERGIGSFAANQASPTRERRGPQLITLSSPGAARSAEQAAENNKRDIGSARRVEVSISASSSDRSAELDTSSRKLVFGLSSRTNRVRHNEYAAGRSSVQSPSADITQESNKAKLVGTNQSSSGNINSDNNECDDRLMEKQIPSETLVVSKSKTKKVKKRDKTTSASNQPNDLSNNSNNMVSTGNKRQAEQSSRKSDSQTTTSNNSNSCRNLDNADQQQPQQQQIVTKQIGADEQATAMKPVKMQFNIPPPPPSKISSNKSSLVSYAKARIYDKQPPTISTSILPSGVDNFEPANSGPPSPSSSTLNNLSRSIVAGFKPPKQVDVSKAREKWEGGEPFAKCKSRQRLAATQAGKKQLHGSWSMTSLVATQQMQLQQALAQSASRGQKSFSGVGGSGYNQSSDDMPVKILPRGSVLERVQKFELAPSAGELAEASFGVEAGPPVTLDLNDNQQALKTKDTCFVESPVAGMTTDQYLSTLNNARRKTLEELKIAGSDCATISSSPSPLSSPLFSESHSPLKRLSFRRQSSASSLNSLASKIPKFYHPNGKPNTYEIELQRRNIVACFDKFPDRKACLIGPNCRRNFHQIALACGFTEYFKEPLLLYVKHLEPTWSQERAAHPMARKQSSFERVPSLTGVGSIRRQSIVTDTNKNNDKQQQQSSSSANTANKTTPRGGASRPSLIRSASIDVTRSAEINNQENNPNNSKIVSDANGNGVSLKYITCDQYFVCWRHLIEHAYDNAARFIHLLTYGKRNYLLPDDFIPLIQCIIDDHPGLGFLGSAPDFHMRYIQTVIARIYFDINKSWTGKISQAELRHSNLLQVLDQLTKTDDINEITDYFSYEHFYVIYCKFWSLDQDHDLEISKEDLIRHNEASISSRFIERIFMGIVSKQIQERGKMGYSDFVWFLIAEEDKKHPRSIEYWFRLMDIDGDGYISMYEMEYFYFEQMKRLELMSIEPLPFIDCACQMLDLVNPKEKNRISLSDLKRTKMVTIFYDTFINLEKYLEHESREFVSTRDVIINGKIISDWERYATQEYESLISEETTV